MRREAGAGFVRREGATAPGHGDPADGRRERPSERGSLRVARWRDDRVDEGTSLEVLAAWLSEQAGTFWIDLGTPNHALVADITRLLGLHPLIAEDIVEGNQRSKIEVTNDHVHVVMFALEVDGEVRSSEIDMVLGQRFLLTVHGSAWDPRRAHQLREGLAPILSHGPDHLLWALTDQIVDDYFPALDRLGDAVDELEDRVIAQPNPATLDQIFGLKRDLITVRRAVAPVREIFNQLTNRELELVDAEEILYFRDVYDHLIRLTDELDTLRELVSGTLDAYLSTVNNNLSLIMKRLTGITVILAGIGAIAGIFGMSEAGAAFNGAEAAGFWLVTLGAVVLASGAALALRRIGWI